MSPVYPARARRPGPNGLVAVHAGVLLLSGVSVALKKFPTDIPLTCDNEGFADRFGTSVARAITRILHADLVVDDIGLLPVGPDAGEGLYASPWSPAQWA